MWPLLLLLLAACAPVGDFRLRPEAEAPVLEPGQALHLGFRLERQGFYAPVSLRLEGPPGLLHPGPPPPGGLGYALEPNPLLGEEGTLILWAGEGLPPGEYVLTLRGKGATVQTN
ncbi:hypothetical protein DV704_11120 [Meiothermus sp. QL-1]|uniref:hypothetical protein n=1 Tax=Meiothermus sp. QL-1 TaxID=2058095 RepID=UPI000E0C7EC9|nr:hypothetical protein [Meiothermus sp. QL-1]RDI94683.1 hypothetical protein DV704_11120 [Meiothermus sp. QL-1]